MMFVYPILKCGTWREHFNGQVRSTHHSIFRKSLEMFIEHHQYIRLKDGLWCYFDIKRSHPHLSQASEMNMGKQIMKNHSYCILMGILWGGHKQKHSIQNLVTSSIIREFHVVLICPLTLFWPWYPIGGENNI